MNMFSRTFFSHTLGGLLATGLLLCHLPLQAAALMDLVDIEGIRDNQLIGYGLVVGLDGTGDKNQVKFTSQSVTNMIKQFSENSQFIIVTHNKQTMGAVDVIYGVTMQEPGVSKLVPVDFRSLN